MKERTALPKTTLKTSCFYYMFKGCKKLSSVTCLATSISAEFCTTNRFYGAGTAEGCERKLYVVSDAMLNPGTDSWNLSYSGEEGKRWTTAVAP